MRPPESFIGQPIRSLQTMLRTIAEDRPGYLPVIPDGIYGPETQRAVTVFQRNHGLPPSGLADQDTWETVAAEFELARISQDSAQPLHLLLDPGQIIRRGERHPHLYLVQAILTVLSEAYESIEEPTQTGILDSRTADSLASFQQLTGLPMTGELDKRTWKHLALHYPPAASLLVHTFE